MSEENNNPNKKSILSVLMEKGWPEKIKEIDLEFQKKLTETKLTGWRAILIRDLPYAKEPSIKRKNQLTLIKGGAEEEE